MMGLNSPLVGFETWETIQNPLDLETWLRSRQPYEFMRPSFAPMPLRAEYSCAVGAPVSGA